MVKTSLEEILSSQAMLASLVADLSAQKKFFAKN